MRKGIHFVAGLQFVNKILLMMVPICVIGIIKDKETILFYVFGKY